MALSVILVGAGNMGGAMLRGWIANGMAPSDIQVLDPSPAPAMADYLSGEGIACHASAETMAPADVLLIAVKPQMMETVLPGLKSLIGKNTVAVSIAAGTQIADIAAPLGNPATVRVMPNTPALVGRGISVACPHAFVTQTQRDNISTLLQAIGEFEWIEDETLMDAVTALSGSGPAYVFHLAECMAEAGKAAGLPDDLAMTLARATVSGAGELLRQSSDAPATLRKNVTSPGGTTAAALEVLMGEGAMPALLREAIKAARERSKELS